MTCVLIRRGSLDTQRDTRDTGAERKDHMEEVWERVAGRQLSASQRERSRETPNLLIPGLLASRAVRK